MNKFSINIKDFINTNLTTSRNATLNVISPKMKKCKSILSDENYPIILLKKLSKPLPKIISKIKLTKRPSDLSTNNDINTFNDNKTKQTNKIISHAKTTSPKLIKIIKKSKLTKTPKIKNVVKLDKLYGYDKNFYESKTNLKKNIEENPLKNYQEDILKIAGRTMSRDLLFKLFTDLNGVRKNAEMIKPLPPMNFNSLIIHSIHENEKRKREIGGKSFDDMDDFEKEMYSIKKGKSFRRNIIIRNKRLYKIYEVLPEHVVETLKKYKMLKI